MKTFCILLSYMLITFISICQANDKECNMPELWFQHDDYFDPDLSDNINEKEIAADMLERWVKHKNWQKCLKKIDVYSIHENLFKIGNPDGMGGKFYRFLINYFGPLDTIELYKSYLRLILPIFT